jgi:hypothetical protein
MKITNAGRLCDERSFPWILRCVDTRRYPDRYRAVLDIDADGGSYSLPIEGWDGMDGGAINGEVLVMILTTAKPAGTRAGTRGHE